MYFRIGFILAVIPFSLGAFNFSRVLAQKIVALSNQYLHLPIRIIFDVTNGQAEHEFLQEISIGHKVTVLFLDTNKMTSSDELLVLLNENDCDGLLILGKDAELPPILRHKPRDGKTFIVMDSPKVEDIRAVMKAMWTRNKLMDTIVLALYDGVLKLYSWMPYQALDCEDVRKVSLIDFWSETHSMEDRPLFHAVPTNLNKCSLGVTTRVVVPYVTEGFNDGYEMRIVHILMKYYNFTIRFVNVPENENFWNIESGNGTLSGAFKLLVNQETDMVFAGLTTQADRYWVSLPLYPHIYEYLSWIAPAPHFLTPMEKNIRVFEPYLWLSLTISIVAASLAVLSLRHQKLSTFMSSILYILAIFCNGMPPFKPRAWPLRLLTFSLVIAAFHIFVAYQSILIFILSTAIPKQPFSNVGQMADAGFECFMIPSALRMLKRYNDPNETQYQNCREFTTPPPFDKVAYNGAYLLFPMTAAKFRTNRDFTDVSGRALLYFLPEPFAATPISFYMSPGNTLAENFNRKIQQIVESGVLQYWKIWNDRISRTTNVYDQDNLKPLGMDNMFFAFVVLFISLMLCTCVFIGEIIVEKFRYKPVYPFIK